MWSFKQRTGEWCRLDSESGERHVAWGYSGHAEGKNNPAKQDVPDIGPIPCGTWTAYPPHDTTTHGPYVMALVPSPETQTFGRSGFLIHGDSKEAPGTASKGCIILPPQVRKQFWESGDHTIKVIVG